MCLKIFVDQKNLEDFEMNGLEIGEHYYGEHKYRKKKTLFKILKLWMNNSAKLQFQELLRSFSFA